MQMDFGGVALVWWWYFIRKSMSVSNSPSSARVPVANTKDFLRWLYDRTLLGIKYKEPTCHVCLFLCVMLQSFFNDLYHTEHHQLKNKFSTQYQLPLTPFNQTRFVCSYHFWVECLQYDLSAQSSLGYILDILCQSIFYKAEFAVNIVWFWINTPLIFDFIQYVHFSLAF